MINIQISVQSPYPSQDPRNRALRAHLLAQDFTISERRGGWQAVRHHGEGSSVKAALRAAGFADCDYHIRVEYQRRWGYL